MDAAQMLTAQEIARQCEHLARVAEQRASDNGSAVSARPVSAQTVPARQGRHLHLADPITQPIERITAPAPEPAREPEQESVAFRAHGLSSREHGMLAFERQWWKRVGAKERAIRELFDMSSSRYYQVLNALIDKPEALRADPMLIKRLRRVRESRQRRRNAHGQGATHRETEY